MKFSKFNLAAVLFCSAMIVSTTSCSEEDGPTDTSSQITAYSLEGLWVTPASDAYYGITRGDDGKIVNNLGESKSKYQVTCNYFITYNPTSDYNGSYTQYFDGMFGCGYFTVSSNDLIYGGKAQLKINSRSSAMNGKINNIEIMDYKYNNSKKLLTSASLMVPVLSRDKTSFTNSLASATSVICTIIPNTSGPSLYFESWEEDEEGNIYNYIDHGNVLKGGNTYCYFAVFSDRVYLRATTYGNKNAEIAYFDLSDAQGGKTQRLIWD